MLRTKIPKNKSGIYQIRSKINGKIYIGSAVYLQRRKNDHFEKLQKNQHCNKYLQRHTNKYSINDLIFEIVEICNKEDLIIKEQYYINSFKPEFNLCKIAGSVLGFKWDKKSKDKITGVLNHNYLMIPSDELRQKRKENAIKYWENSKNKERILGKNSHFYGKNKTKENNYFFGKKHSTETKIKNGKLIKNWYDSEKGIAHRKIISERKKGKPAWNKGKTGIYTPETINKMRLAKIGGTSWNKSLTKNTDNRLKKLSELFTGEGNPMYGKPSWNKKIL